jgi:hypothetical protein
MKEARIDNEETDMAVMLDGGDVVYEVVPGIERRPAGEGPANPADVGSEAKTGIAACPVFRGFLGEDESAGGSEREARESTASLELGEKD